jgi:hypothetical protein
MPVSEKFAPLLAREDRELDKLRARRELVARVLEALPPEVPVPAAVDAFGYCAAATLRFSAMDDEPLRCAFTVLQPLPLVDVYSPALGLQTQKPAAYVRSAEARAGQITPLYPVLLRSNPGTAGQQQLRARWWTKLAETDIMVEADLGPGQDTRVAVPQPLRSKLSPGLHSFGNGQVQFFRRSLAPLRLPPLPTLRWSDAWDDWVAQQGLRTPAQKAAVYSLRHLLYAVQTEDVPQLLEGRRWLSHVEGADRTLTAEQVEALAAFARQQAAALAAARADEDALAQRLHQWLAAFFERHGTRSANPPQAEKLAWLAQRDLGVAFELFLHEAPDGVGVTFLGGNAPHQPRHEWQFVGTSEKRIDWNSLPVEYD